MQAARCCFISLNFFLNIFFIFNYQQYLKGSIQWTHILFLDLILFQPESKTMTIIKLLSYF